MKHHKNAFELLSLTFVLLTINACSNNKESRQRQDFQITATLGGSYNIDTSQFAHIVGKLHNLSSDTLSFLSMTCSWDDAWKVSSPNLEIVKNICFSNVPILIKLGPNESMVNYLPVRLLKPYQEIKDEKFLIGFNLVKADTVDFSTSIEALQSTKNFFWSDTLQLNKLVGLNTVTKEK